MYDESSETGDSGDSDETGDSGLSGDSCNSCESADSGESRGRRYVLIIHFYVESGQKFIQFNIQFKIRSKIFIQKGKNNSKFGGKLA